MNDLGRIKIVPEGEGSKIIALTDWNDLEGYNRWMSE